MSDQSTLTHEPQVLGPPVDMWSRTGLKPADVDVAAVSSGSVTPPGALLFRIDS